MSSTIWKPMILLPLGLPPPMFLMARSIKSHGIKMVLSGEGADELLEVICTFIKPFSRGIPQRNCQKTSQIASIRLSEGQ